MASSKLAPTRLDDAVFGTLGKWLPSSPGFDHLVRFLNTYSGSDKALGLIQSTLKLLVVILQARAGLRHRDGKRATPASSVATNFGKLAGLISDSQMLWRLFGILPIIQWFTSLEKSPLTNRRVLTIERLQCLAMFAYYPLEHLYYLGAHSVYPMEPKRLKALSIWSSRAWAAYVVLQLLHLKEDFASLKERAKALRVAKRTEQKEGGHVELARETAAIKKRGLALKGDFIANLAYLPQTIHWSLDQGLFSNSVWVTMLSFVAAASSFKGGWEASK